MDQELVAYLDRRFSDLDRRLDSRFGDIDSRFGDMDSRFDDMDSRFVDVDSRFVDIDGRFRQASEERAELRRDTGGQIRQLHVLAEGLRDDIRAVAEGVDANHEAHQELRRELDLRFEDLRTWCASPWADLDRRTRDNSLRIGGLDNRVTGLENR